jgi:hypothetical protein
MEENLSCVLCDAERATDSKLEREREAAETDAAAAASIAVVRNYFRPISRPRKGLFRTEWENWKGWASG